MIYKTTGALFLALLVNTAYIAAFADPTVFYMGNVLIHFLLGIALAIAVGLLFLRRRDLARELAVAAAAGPGGARTRRSRPCVDQS